ncbi:nitroreductase family deazaflavin-dependent oxidoreductase [Marisediminicola sp. LYQ134]|uniref:nitroreductase family deazaflavin-dependent oxidoreductase n=1 Tax=unclassified Marisediminicola TaxID=2618316 RepID=UPI0039832F6A
MPSDLTMKAMNVAHRTLLAVTGGRVGWKAMGMPVIELTTIGRKSGEPRSAMLTAPLVEGDSYVIVASKGGEPTHPAWYLNLRDEPRVEVRIEGRPVEKRVARVASQEERDRMWPLITGRYRNYAGYQKRTSRQIPLVVLEPLG